MSGHQIPGIAEGSVRVGTIVRRTRTMSGADLTAAPPRPERPPQRRVSVSAALNGAQPPVLVHRVAEAAPDRAGRIVVVGALAAVLVTAGAIVTIGDGAEPTSPFARDRAVLEPVNRPVPEVTDTDTIEADAGFAAAMARVMVLPPEIALPASPWVTPRLRYPTPPVPPRTLPVITLPAPPTSRQSDPVLALAPGIPPGSPFILVSAPIPVPVTPVGPAPVGPAPVDPTPVDPGPVPVDPTPTDPTPTDPTPTDPAPTDPIPTDPTGPDPTDPAVPDPAPVDPPPVDPGPLAPGPASDTDPAAGLG